MIFDKKLKRVGKPVPKRLSEALLVLLSFFPSLGLAKESVAADAIVGAAQGAILGLVVVIYVFVWKPIKKWFDASKVKKSVLKNALTPLMLASAEGNDAEVSRLIHEGADVNGCGKSGETALMLAAKNDRRSTARLLLKSGADAHAKTLKGNTARDIARQQKKFVMSDILGEEQ